MDYPTEIWCNFYKSSPEPIPHASKEKADKLGIRKGEDARIGCVRYVMAEQGELE